MDGRGDALQGVFRITAGIAPVSDELRYLHLHAGPFSWRLILKNVTRSAQAWQCINTRLLKSAWRRRQEPFQRGKPCTITRDERHVLFRRERGIDRNSAKRRIESRAQQGHATRGRLVFGGTSHPHAAKDGETLAQAVELRESA